MRRTDRTFPEGALQSFRVTRVGIVALAVALFATLSATSAAPPVVFTDLTPSVQARIDEVVRDPIRTKADEPTTGRDKRWRETFERAQPGRAPDSAVAALFARLTHMAAESRPGTGRDLRLVMLDVKGPVFAVDRSETVYAPLSYTTALMAAGRRGEASVAFGFAQAIGHIVLGSGDRSDRPIGLPSFPPNSAYRADLFALRLCRVAGFDADAALDGLRWQVAALDPRAIERIGNPDPAIPTTPSPHSRLARLLDDLDGRPAATAPFGLLQFDRATGKFTRAKDGAVRRGRPAIVFVHGLHGSEATFEAMLPAVADDARLRDIPILIYRYPAQGSLSMAGAGLAREMKRVCPEVTGTRFVAHSAGGLVARWYAEKLGGEMNLAITLGTPHAGSAMTALAPLAGMRAWLRSPHVDDKATSISSTAEGDGQMARDLEPGSLFLRDLGTSATGAAKIVAVYGRLGAGRLVDTEPPTDSDDRPAGGPRRRLVPEEIANGDGCVAVQSARLPGARETIALRLDHLAIKSDHEAIALVIRLLTDTKSTRPARQPDR